MLGLCSCLDIVYSCDTEVISVSWCTLGTSSDDIWNFLTYFDWVPRGYAVGVILLFCRSEVVPWFLVMWRSRCLDVFCWSRICCKLDVSYIANDDFSNFLTYFLSALQIRCSVISFILPVWGSQKHHSCYKWFDFQYCPYALSLQLHCLFVSFWPWADISVLVPWYCQWRCL